MRGLLWWLLAACTPPRAATDTPVTVRIAAINDFHGALYEMPAPGQEGLAIGGLPWLVSAVKALRADAPELLVLDGGDTFQGSWPVNASQGTGAVQAMELLGLDATAIGNHEFDYGGIEGGDPRRGALERAAAQASYPFLSANIRLESGERYAPEGVQPWTILSRKGRRIVVIGLTTTDTPQTTVAAHVQGLTFVDPVEAVREILPEVEAAEPDAVVLVGHLTGQCDPTAYLDPGAPCVPSGEIGALLTELEPAPFSVMVLGHAHTLLSHRSGDTFLLESRAKGHAIGQVELVFDRDGLDLVRSRLLPTWALTHEPADPGCSDAPFPTEPRDVGGRELIPDAEALALVAELEAAAGSLCDPLGCATRSIERAYDTESELGNWLTDAMLAAFPDADLAIQNSGGIRAALPEGPLRREHLHAVMPFDNRTLVVELTGAELKQLFRIGTSGAHGVLQVAGARYAYDPSRTGGTDIDGDGRVDEWEHDRLCPRSLLVGGAPIDEGATYRVVTNDFLVGGGDHLGPVFADARVVSEGAPLREVFYSYAEAAKECIGSEPLVDAKAPRIRAGACR